MTLNLVFGHLVRPISLGVVKEDQLEKLIPFGVNLSTPLSELAYIPLAKQQSQLLRKKWGTIPYTVCMLLFRLQKCFLIENRGHAGFEQLACSYKGARTSRFLFFVPPHLSHWVLMESGMVSNLDILRFKFLNFSRGPSTENFGSLSRCHWLLAQHIYALNKLSILKISWRFWGQERQSTF